MAEKCGATFRGTPRKHSSCVWPRVIKLDHSTSELYPIWSTTIPAADTRPVVQCCRRCWTASPAISSLHVFIKMFSINTRNNTLIPPNIVTMLLISRDLFNTMLSEHSLLAVWPNWPCFPPALPPHWTFSTLLVLTVWCTRVTHVYDKWT